MTEELTKQQNESGYGFIYRLCKNKDVYNLTWRNISNIVNKELHIYHTESWYRKNYKTGVFNTYSSTDLLASNTENKENAKLSELQVLRSNILDEAAENRRLIRRLSREENIKEIAKYYAEVLSESNPLKIEEKEFIADKNSNEGILLLSDWHYGMVCNNPYNKYTPDICIERLGRLLGRVKDIVKKNNISKVTVLNLSDLIAGRIHSQIRIESRFDVITQVMDVAELLVNFLNHLSSVCKVDYYDCLDNHSRIEPNKKESLDLESLVRIITWHIRFRLNNNKSINVYDNEFGPGIITCNIKGHDIIATHGHEDRPSTALSSLSMMTHKHYDMMCTAHLHHFSADEINQSVIISNGSLMGVDQYSEKLRLTSDPSQTFIVLNENDVCECIYRINLK